MTPGGRLVDQEELSALLLCQAARHLLLCFGDEALSVIEERPDPGRLVVGGGDNTPPVRTVGRRDHPISVSLQRGYDLPGRCVPYPSSPVVGGGENAPAVGTEDRSIEAVFMSLQGRQVFPACGFPDSDLLTCPL